MLIYEWSDVSKGIDFDKTDKSKECIICYYWYFKDKNLNFEKPFCNGCHDISIMCYEIENIAIFKIEGVDYRCILWNMSYDKAFYLLNNSKLDKKDSLWMVFNPNKTPIEKIKEGEFGVTYFRDLHSGVNGKWCRNSWKEFNDLKNIDRKYYSSNYYDAELNKCKFKTETPLRFLGNKGWIIKIDLYGLLQWYFRYFLGRRSSDNFRQTKRWKNIVSRFKGKLVKMIKDSGGEFDDYLISPKIRQILLHLGYELTGKWFFNNPTNQLKNIFFVYYQFNKKDILQKAKDK